MIYFFFAAQRAFRAATIRARPSGLNLRFFRLLTDAGLGVGEEFCSVEAISERAC